MQRIRTMVAALAAVAALVAVSAATAQDPPSPSDRGHDQSAFSLVVAGDVACTPGEVGAAPTGQPNGPDNCQQAETAQLVETLSPDAVAVPGDIQYQYGRYSEFMGSYDPTWGAFKSITYPVPGNHEWYDAPNGNGYFDYFNGPGTTTGRVGTRGQGYYSVDLNARWHLIALNSNCTSDNPRITAPVPCSQGSEQERWLRADLAAHRGMCVIAEWHHPFYTSGPNRNGVNDVATQSFWHDLYAAGATLVFNGHDHGYERFAPQNDTGQRDLEHGVREFVVGTGGKSLFGSSGYRAPNSEIYDATTFGVLKLTLHPHSYDWMFYREPVAGNGVLVDAGSAPCNTAADSGD